MTTDEAFEEARRRILDAERTGAEGLDLGDLQLKALPDELSRLRELRYLALGQQALQRTESGWESEWNEGRPEQSFISDLRSLSGLIGLQTLSLAGWEAVSNLQPLAGLSTLRSLDLTGCKAVSALQPLASLARLQSLDLTGCELVSDIMPLANISALQSLSLEDCRGVANLRPLAGLPGLQSLNLWGCASLIAADFELLSTLSGLRSLNLVFCNGMTDLRPLAGLTELRSLVFGGSKDINDLKPLSNLSGLQTLGLYFCQGVSNLTPLSMLKGLQSLQLRGCYSLADLAPLSVLCGLRSLSLSHCRSISGLEPVSRLSGLQSLQVMSCNSVVSLNPLSGIAGLQALCVSYCKRVANLKPLSGMTELKTLDVSFCRKVTSLKPLSRLPALQSLILWGCNSITDVGPLSSLSTLRSVNLNGCVAVTCFEPLTPLLHHLDELFIHGCSFQDLPNELGGEYLFENMINRVRAHYADLAREAVEERELKVCVLGNGRVGKTQMCRRLSVPPQAFDPGVRTTHGIELGHTEVTIDGKAVRLNLWDFGGQDIYHGSHALFVGGRAIFVIAWSPAHETGESIEGGAVFRNRPLSYWLDFVRGLAGPDSPVLVVQCQCDAPADERPVPLPPHDFRRLRTVRFSARSDLGLTLLRGELEEAVRDFFSRQPPLAIGRGRVEVRNHLRTMLEEDQRRAEGERRHRTLTREEFDELCQQNGKVTSAEALLEYLHRSGVLFYRDGLFGDRILLDQNWALRAIYTLFDRERVVPILNRHGRFTRKELELLIWSEFPVAEQELFLDLMRQCGICFPVRELAEHDREYVAPELLPEWSTAQEWLVGRMLGGRNRSSVTVRYRFLHEGILRGLLSRVGRQARTAAEYWKYGCWFYDKRTESQILIRSELEEQTGKGTVTLEAIGEQPQALLEIVLKELLSLQVGEPPEVERSWEMEAAPRAAKGRRPRKSKPSTSAAAVEEILAAAGEQAGPSDGMSQLDVSGWPPPAADEPVSVYLSYAWGDDKDDMGRQRGMIAEALCRVVEEETLQLLVDKREMRTGDWISTFMEQIGRGSHILVVLSEKYFQSRYCMQELHYIFERSLGKKADFLQRVMPFFLDDVAGLGGAESCDRYIEYWKGVRKAMLPKLKAGRLSANDYNMVYQNSLKWQIDLETIVGFLTDPIYPRGRAAIEKDNYAAVRAMLAKIPRNRH